MAFGSSRFWLYVRVQLMCLTGGIVGPIFLTVYFAAQPDPMLKWMYHTGRVITAVDVLVAITITDRLARSRQPAREQEPEST